MTPKASKRRVRRCDYCKAVRRVTKKGAAAGRRYRCTATKAFAVRRPAAALFWGASSVRESKQISEKENKSGTYCAHASTNPELRFNITVIMSCVRILGVSASSSSISDSVAMGRELPVKI